ncbi:MAG TPA: AAA family ATPase [Pyrinomonadaceae bacterium]
MKKELVIIAGANGVGKTTFARAFLREYDYESLNADEIAKTLSAENPAKKIKHSEIFTNMKNGKSKISAETYEKALEFQRIGNRGVREAQAENHRLGLPNIYSRNGKIIYEMPDGEIVVKENPQK